MFNIRVYGILLNEQNQYLVSDEYVGGMYLTKFCGGGLEFGEGTRDCLKREFLEEMNLQVEVTSHFYTTDFFQISAFNPSHQIISIYYHVKALAETLAPISTERIPFDTRQTDIYAQAGGKETFRFIDKENFTPDCFTLPIDKLVAKLLIAAHEL